MTKTRAPQARPEQVNTVRLVGRLSFVDEPKELPSGDAVQMLRVVVPRPGVTGRASVDTIDVACWSPATRRSASRLRVGEQVEVCGALHRRFFRGGTGVSSRYEVEARTLRRMPAAPPSEAEP